MNPTSYIQKDARVIIEACEKAVEELDDEYRKEIEDATIQAGIKKRWFRKNLYLTREEAYKKVCKRGYNEFNGWSRKKCIERRMERLKHPYETLKRLAEASSGTVWLCKEDNERLDRYY